MAISELPRKADTEPLGSRLPGCFTPEMKRYFTDMLSGSFGSFTQREVRAIVRHYMPSNPLIAFSSEIKARMRHSVTQDVESGFDREYIWRGLASDVMYFSPSHSHHPFGKTTSADIHLFVDNRYLCHLGRKDGPPVLSSQEKEALFTDPKVWENAAVSCGFSPISPMMHHHLRRVFTAEIYSYNYNRKGFLEMLAGVRKRQGKSEEENLLGLDIGGSNGHAAFLLEEADQNLLVTNLTYEPELGMRPLRGGHRIGMAEQMPSEWREKFDVIMSNSAFMHMQYPSLALLNTVEALEVNGALLIDFGWMMSDLKFEAMILFIDYLKDKGIVSLQNKRQIYGDLADKQSIVYLVKTTSIPQDTIQQAARMLGRPYK